MKSDRTERGSIGQIIPLFRDNYYVMLGSLTSNGESKNLDLRTFLGVVRVNKPRAFGKHLSGEIP